MARIVTIQDYLDWLRRIVEVDSLREGGRGALASLVEEEWSRFVEDALRESQGDFTQAQFDSLVRLRGNFTFGLQPALTLEAERREARALLAERLPPRSAPAGTRLDVGRRLGPGTFQIVARDSRGRFISVEGLPRRLTL